MLQDHFSVINGEHLFVRFAIDTEVSLAKTIILVILTLTSFLFKHQLLKIFSVFVNSFKYDLENALIIRDGCLRKCKVQTIIIVWTAVSTVFKAIEFNNLIWFRWVFTRIKLSVFPICSFWLAPLDLYVDKKLTSTYNGQCPGWFKVAPCAKLIAFDVGNEELPSRFPLNPNL